MSHPSVVDRKGARTPSLVPADIVAGLSEGRLSTVNFMEQFALDLDRLVRGRLPEVEGREALLMDLPLKARLDLAGQRLAQAVPADALHDRTSEEPDTVRSIAAFASVHAAGESASSALEALRPFADDPHFGVREWAWIALRHRHGDAVAQLVPELSEWARHESPRLRRFSSEVLRGRGVWSRHLALVKRDPAIALPVIEKLSSDPARYVQLSVGNWLNDAAKDHPEWVVRLCRGWLAVGASQATAVICRRGMRSLT